MISLLHSSFLPPFSPSEQLVQDYAELSSLSQQITTTVPLGLLSRIDSLTNPHEYTKNLLTTALEANQYGNAKLHAYGRQYELLAKEIGESFPEMRGMLGMPVSMGEEETRAEKEQKNVVKNEQETDVNAIPGSTSGHERKEEAVEISLNSPEQEQKPYHQQQQQHQQVHLSQVAAAAAAGTDTSASTYDATRVDVTTTTTTTSGDVDMQ